MYILRIGSLCFHWCVRKTTCILNNEKGGSQPSVDSLPGGAEPGLNGLKGSDRVKESGC